MYCISTQSYHCPYITRSLFEIHNDDVSQKNNARINIEAKECEQRKILQQKLRAD